MWTPEGFNLVSSSYYIVLVCTYYSVLAQCLVYYYRILSCSYVLSRNCYTTNFCFPLFSTSLALLSFVLPQIPSHQRLENYEQVLCILRLKIVEAPPISFQN